MDGFLSRKDQVVSSLVEALDPERKDKSPKGFVDAPILDLIHIINAHPDYYTTSSCSGRIAIYREGIEEKTTKGGVWLYVTHDPVEIPATADDGWIVRLLFGPESDRVVFESSGSVNPLEHQLIYFKFEPLILHVEASSQDTSMRLTSLAYQAGYQNSGMTPSRSRHMLAIRSTHKLDTPIAYVDPVTGKICCLVNPGYLRLLMDMSNEKFRQNMDRMKAFEIMMQAEVDSVTSKTHEETKEERRQRKKKEGIARQQAMAQSTKDKSLEDNLTDLNLE
ncbi:hypothetical protein EC973_008161 [Apophysomyces ossiformis]|uniref:tRNA(Phe) 7-[(3-amino-3-carboxypropyl)-4-demethylwyosine(37)-N(4)]-methyltransferase n=1 Tax=Apophysomyces ossiformis TaxID=679940 RepID=A0A8H7ER62_9FUNG|nr:hypothetical protein EC973_008161 [Apophysomyces ossiformis]